MNHLPRNKLLKYQSTVEIPSCAICGSDFRKELFGGTVVLVPVFCTADVPTPSVILFFWATLTDCVEVIITSLRVSVARSTFSLLLSVVTSSVFINILL